MQIPTVKIVAKNELGFMIIDEENYKSSEHTIYTEPKLTRQELKLGPMEPGSGPKEDKAAEKKLAKPQTKTELDKKEDFF